MTVYEIKADFIPLLDPEIEVIEKLTIHRPFEFGVGPEKITSGAKAGEFGGTQESNIYWTRSDGLVITRVKYFAQTG